MFLHFYKHKKEVQNVINVANLFITFTSSFCSFFRGNLCFCCFFLLVFKLFFFIWKRERKKWLWPWMRVHHFLFYFFYISATCRIFFSSHFWHATKIYTKKTTTTKFMWCVKVCEPEEKLLSNFDEYLKIDHHQPHLCACVCVWA